MRIINKCRCKRHHRNSAYFARCAWPNAAEVLGKGQLAIVTTCHEPRVFLIERLRPAQILRNELAVFGCGRGCTGNHELVAIDYDAPPEENA